MKKTKTGLVEKKNSSVMAAIVSCNPDISLLRDNLTAVCSQVKLLVLYDNASENLQEIEELVYTLQRKENRICGELRLVKNRENLGLPVNYNRALETAAEEKFEWLLLLDQDTVIPENLVTSYMKYAGCEKAAVLCPRIWDIHLRELERADRCPSDEAEESSTALYRCASSGSLNRVETARRLGGFDEKLFIDVVDFDYCRNIRKHGYRILQIHDCVVRHQTGNSTKRQFLMKKIVLRNYPPFRYYYIFRNRVYDARKFRISPWKEPGYYLVFPKMLLLSLFERQSLQKIRESVRGIRDGLHL